MPVTKISFIMDKCIKKAREQWQDNKNYYFPRKATRVYFQQLLSTPMFRVDRIWTYKFTSGHYDKIWRGAIYIQRRNDWRRRSDKVPWEPKENKQFKTYDRCLWKERIAFPIRMTFRTGFFKCLDYNSPLQSSTSHNEIMSFWLCWKCAQIRLVWKHARWAT